MAVRASAPGRVNLIGEHTDYNDGFVMPIATPQRTEITLTVRDDDRVCAWSANVDEADRAVEYRLGGERRRGEWVDYIAGVTEAIRQRGCAIRGFDARIESSVPLGAGLASSASLEVALVRALNDAFGLHLEDVEMAHMAHRAETGLVGAPVGIMDQMAASLAGEDAALFLDTRTLAFERMPLPPETRLIVIHSGVVHSHASGEYRIRRRECEEGARLLGAASLREVDAERLVDAALPPPIDRRARHVVTENARVLRARDALRAGDARTFGALMNASHQSMRDDFEISTTEIDALVGLAQAEPPVFGARLTGGGFGGSIVALAEAESAAPAAKRIAEAYASRVSVTPTILVP